MNALITGASGFIGSTLIELLNEQGIKDVGALMRKSSSPSNLEGLSYQRVEGDLADVESLKRAVRGKEYIFHLAGLVTATNASAYFEGNARGAENLLEAIKQEKPPLKRLVYVSSLAAAGPAHSLKSPRTEDEENRPVSNYGKSKLAAEVSILEHKNTIPISVIRPPIVYGPRDKGVLTLVKSVTNRVVPELRGNTETGDKYYSTVHAKDLCRGIAQAATVSGLASGEVFYVAGDAITSYSEIMSEISSHLNIKVLKLRIPMVAVKAGAAALDVLGSMTGRSYLLNKDKLNEIIPDYWTCSNEKARTQLKFVPEFSFVKGIVDALEWYKKKNWI